VAPDVASGSSTGPSPSNPSSTGAPVRTP
jgi:hypothetical protein